VLSYHAYTTFISAPPCFAPTSFYISYVSPRPSLLLSSSSTLAVCTSNSLFYHGHYRCRKTPQIFRRCWYVVIASKFLIDASLTRGLAVESPRTTRSTRSKRRVSEITEGDEADSIVVRLDSREPSVAADAPRTPKRARRIAASGSRTPLGLSPQKVINSVFKSSKSSVGMYHGMALRKMNSTLTRQQHRRPRSCRRNHRGLHNTEPCYLRKNQQRPATVSASLASR